MPPFVVSPEHLMYAAVAAYSTELRVLDVLAARPTATLPPEIIFHIRLFLQRTITDHIASETQSAVAAFESMFVASLCDDCIAFNSDVFGTDVWSWLESGCKGDCECRSDLRRRPPSSDADYMRPIRLPRVGPDGPLIESRIEWIDSYLSAIYLCSKPAWAHHVRNVLASLSCSIVADSGPVRQHTDGGALGKQRVSGSSLEWPCKVVAFARGVSLQPEGDQDGCVVFRRITRVLGICPNSASPTQGCSLRVSSQILQRLHAHERELQPRRYWHRFIHDRNETTGESTYPSIILVSTAYLTYLVLSRLLCTLHCSPILAHFIHPTQ